MSSNEKENNASPEDLRLVELKKRFTNLGVSVEKNSKARIETLEEGLLGLEKAVTELSEDQALLRTKKCLTDLQEKFEEIHLEKDSFENEFHKRLGRVGEDFRLNLDDLRADNRALVSEFSKQGTDRLFALGLGLGKSQKAFQDQLDGYTLRVEEGIDQMREQVERENQEREECAENIEVKIMAELDRLEEDIAVERGVKEETNVKIKSLIEEMHRELWRKIEQEKKEREASNHSLLNLLEEACNRIERNFSNLL